MRLLLLLTIIFYNSTLFAQLPIGKRLHNGDFRFSLQLSADSTFYYASTSCYETWVSKGKWQVHGDTLLLDSYDSLASKPVFRITTLHTKKEMITMHYFSAGSQIVFYIDSLKPREFEYLVSNEYGKVFIPRNKYSHFSIEGADTTMYAIPETDFSIYCDYPSEMIDRSIYFFALGGKRYFIKNDGLYLDKDNKYPNYPFPRNR